MHRSVRPASLAGCLLLAFSSAHAAELPEGPLPSAALAALAARDGLIAEGDPEFHGTGARWITSQRTAELDGIPPREVIVEVTEYTGEGTWQTEYRAYRPADPLPTPYARPIITGGYRDPGYLRVVDLDGRGQDALVIVGDTDGGSPSAIDIWRKQGDGWAQQVWGPDAGLDYALFDLADDIAGTAPSTALSLITLRAEEQGFIVEPWLPIDGLYRPWPIDPTPLLAPLLVHLTGHPPHRPDHVLPRLAVTLRAAGVDPGAEALRGLRRMHDQLEDTWDHAAVLDAMSWRGNVAAAPHLRRYLDPPTAPQLMATAAEGLARVGTDDDRSRLLTRLGASDSPAGIRQAIVRGFVDRGDPRARARLVALLADNTRQAEERRALIEAAGAEAAAAPDLTRLLATVERPLQAVILNALWTRALFEPAHPAWRITGVIEAIRPYVADVDPRIARDAITIVEAIDPDARAALRAALSAAGPSASAALRGAVADDPPPGDPIGETIADEALAALEGRPADGTASGGASRRLHHRLIAHHGRDSTRARGLALLAPVPADASILEDYARGMGDAAPSDPAAVQAMATALLPISGPTRPDRVRQRVAPLLGVLDDDRARAALLLLMQRDPVVWVRSTAADALGRRHPDVEAALIVALVREPDESVRSAIIGALGKHGTPRARTALIDRLGHPRDGWAAAHALARVPDAAGLEVGAVLAQRAAAVVRGADGCDAVQALVQALARAGLDASSMALHDAVEVCPDTAASLIGGAIDGWSREGSDDSRRRVVGFAGSDERAISRAAWHALWHWTRR